MLQSHLSSSSKGIFLCWLCFHFFFAFCLFFLRITDFAGMLGDGEKCLCSWSFDTACFGRGQLIIIQLTPCSFCTYSSVQYLYSRQTGSFYSFWNMYSKFLVSEFFLFIYLFIYLLLSVFSDLSFYFRCFIHSKRYSRSGYAPGRWRICFPLFPPCLVLFAFLLFISS